MIKPTKYTVTTEETGSEILVEFLSACNAVEINCPDAEQAISLSVTEAKEVLRAMEYMLWEE